MDSTFMLHGRAFGCMHVERIAETARVLYIHVTVLVRISCTASIRIPITK